jgi:pyruvate dehydrogenase E2 component (dihydrolipoamide acetyltransferase)
MPATNTDIDTDTNTGGDTAATPLARRMAAQAGLDIAAIAGGGSHGKVTRIDVEAAIAGANMTQPLGMPGGRVIASPLARRMAAEAGIDLAAVAGSGPGGRVVKADLEDAAPSPANAAADERGTVETLSTMRKIIAERMAHAKQTVPHFYLTVDCEIDELLKERKTLNAAAKDIRLSVNDFIIRAIALALIEVPDANVMWDDGKLRRFHSADIAVAVALDEGLITPVIRAAEGKGLAQISAEMKDLAARARQGALAPEEYQGGSFTISNLGMFGIKQFEAIINPPQAGILAVGAGTRQAVVKDGALAIATVMSMTLSCDHRVLDGASGAKLLTAIKRLLEYPPQMLL